MADRPSSLPAFEAQFPDEAACARWLFTKRWPEGFRCPGCGHAKGWELDRGLLLVECARCHRQTSVTAGTVLHRSHLSLKLWFLAAWLVATHKNDISARQLWLQLGLGSYKTAWLLLRKLRRAMVDPGREPLAGLVEVDETSLPFRTKDAPVAAKPGRSQEMTLGQFPPLPRRHHPAGPDSVQQRGSARVEALEVPLRLTDQGLEEFGAARPVGEAGVRRDSGKAREVYLGRTDTGFGTLQLENHLKNVHGEGFTTSARGAQPRSQGYRI